MRKNIFFIVFIILCSGSCTDKKLKFNNFVNLKVEMFYMGSEDVFMRYL